MSGHSDVHPQEDTFVVSGQDNIWINTVHPKRKPHLTHETVFVLAWPIRRCSPGCKVIRYVSILGLSTHYKNVFVRSSFIGIFSFGALGILDKWSATTFSTPFLSLISRSNSCKRSIHRISLAFASFFCIKYFRAEWSVKIVVLDPSRYWRNFSNANTTAKIPFQ